MTVTSHRHRRRCRCRCRRRSLRFVSISWNTFVSYSDAGRLWIPRWILPLRAHIIYITNLSRVPSANLPILPLFLCHTNLHFSFHSFHPNPIPARIRTAERRDKRFPNILRLLAPNIASCRNFVKKPAWKCYEMMEALVWFCTIERLFDVNASPLTIVIARGTYVAASALVA